MTQAEYARHRGVSRAAISKLVGRGRIPSTAIDEQGRINPVAADLALGEARQRVLLAEAGAVDEAAIGADDDGDDAVDLGQAIARPAAPINPALAELTKQKVSTETYRAELLRLEHQQKIGQLLPIEDVTAAMQKCAGVIVRELDQLPTFADELAAAVKADGIAGARVALKKISRNIREQLEANMRLAGAGVDKTEAAS